MREKRMLKAKEENPKGRLNSKSKIDDISVEKQHGTCTLSSQRMNGQLGLTCAHASMHTCIYTYDISFAGKLKKASLLEMEQDTEKLEYSQWIKPPRDNVHLTNGKINTEGRGPYIGKKRKLGDEAYFERDLGAKPASKKKVLGAKPILKETWRARPILKEVTLGAKSAAQSGSEMPTTRKRSDNQ